MRIVPIDIAVFYLPFSRQQWHEADAVPLLHGGIFLNTCYFEDGRIKVFNHKIISALRIGSHYTRPAYDHWFADTSFIGGTFSTVEWVVLSMEFSGAGMCGQSAIVGHEKDYGIVC